MPSAEACLSIAIENVMYLTEIQPAAEEPPDSPPTNYLNDIEPSASMAILAAPSTGGRRAVEQFHASIKGMVLRRYQTGKDGHVG